MEEKKLLEKIPNATELQRRIIEVIEGYEGGEVIYSFELLKLAILHKE